ncbi:uncharacterized protein [Ptychodera flava]|uniref:uncharacterized protein n=1 Tax=Ptychodera flava TaxID=63121 RepID=UPI00396A588B
MGSCGGNVVGIGTIYSPGFPGYYMENQECTWHISAQPRSILEFEFVLFNMDEEADSVTLYEMMNGRQRNIEVSNLSATSCSNTVYITFKSGINGGTRRGIFTLKYREVAVPQCPLLPSRVDGILYYNGSCPYLIGDTVSITCKTGFKLSSPHDTVECQQNAMWNGTLPWCIAIDCGNPGEVENADRIGTQYSYNSTVIYTCHDGYYTNGSGTIRCTIEGQWTEKPSCFFNGTQLSESVTASAAGLAIGISLGVVTAILIGLALIIFLMRRKIQLKFRNTLGSSSAIQDEVLYCNEPERRNNIRREGAVNSENLKAMNEDDGYTSVDADQTEDHGCIGEQTGVKKQVKPPPQHKNLKQNGIRKVDIIPQNDELHSNKYENESQRYDNLIIGEKVGKSSLTGDSGSVENVAYESADINDDDGDVYTEIDSTADNVDVVFVHNTPRNDGEGTVDNIAYETADSIGQDRPAYAVRDGP